MNRSSQRASILLGGFMIFVLVLGAIIPIFNNQLSAPTTIDPTDVPTPTFPAPIADVENIGFDELYLHPSGLFAIAQPEGWTPSEPITEENRAAVTFVNNDQLSVIEASVERSVPAVTTLEELDARFNESYLEGSWARYGDWDETARRVENNRLLLDFNLELNRQTYVARQLSWADGDWIYNVRVVTPSNATQMLVAVLNRLVESVTPFKGFVGTPFSWLAYYDPSFDHIIRFPSNWTVTDSIPGGPTSVSGTNNEALRVEMLRDTAVTNEDEASAWVQSARPGATVLSVQPVERDEASGFSVAYSFRTVDGDPFSGLAVLLNDADGNLHAANLRFPGSDIDLNVGAAPEAEATPEATAEPGTGAASDADTYIQIMNSFMLMPDLPFAGVVDATPTPLPPADTAPEATEAETEADETDTANDSADAEPAETEAAAAAEATAEATEA